MATHHVNCASCVKRSDRVDWMVMLLREGGTIVPGNRLAESDLKAAQAIIEGKEPL